MPEALTPGFDIERIERQQGFLIDRARAHVEAKDDGQLWHRACAAKLTHDAAALAVLRGDASQATQLFFEAGTGFASLGIFIGLSLLEYSSPGAARMWRAEHEGFDARVTRAMATDEGPVDRGGGRERFLVASSASPRQLLHLYQALTADQAGDESYLRSHVRQMLLHVPQFPVGPTAVPLAEYVRLLDEVAQMHPNKEAYLSSESSDRFLSQILRRREQLTAARADTWHWKMLLNPADLIDLDLVALSTIMIDRIGSTSPFDEIIGDRGALLAMPLRAAKLLRSAPLTRRHR